MATIEKQLTIKDRLRGLVHTMIEDNPKFNGPIKKMIIQLIDGFLKDANEAELREMLIKLQSELIPWALGEHDKN